MKTFRKHLLSVDSSIKEALNRLNKLALDAIIFVVDSENRLLGSLTDGDVRRGLLLGVTIDQSVQKIIQPNPRFIRKGNYDLEKVIEFRKNNFRIIPIIDRNDRIINIINFREIKSYLPIDGVIMAGGKGKRLSPLTDKIPKPLLKIGDDTIIDHNINRLRQFGIDDIWICLEYLGEMIENHLGNGEERNISIKYIFENEPLGTIGALSKIKKIVHDDVMVLNSDLLTNIDYEHFYLDFIKKEADLSIVTIPYLVDIPYAVLETNNGHILNFKEKPTYTYYSNGGIYLFKKEIIKFIPQNKYFNATDLIDSLIKAGKKVISYPLSGYWLDIGRKEDYNKAQKDIQNINFT